MGVNTDTDRDATRQAVARNGINRRSWWAQAPDGAIPTRWQVHSFPSMFLIDAQGIVRVAHVQPGPQLERTIDALLREATR